MAAATAGCEWPNSSPTGPGSSDTASPVFPDRPIRPLPKRRLRTRLSPEQAESIVFPPAPPSSSQLFSFPYSQMDGAASSSTRNVALEHGHNCDCDINNPSEVESEEEEEGNIPLQSSPTLDRGFTTERNGRVGQRLSKAGSTTSSADGYDSFENTSNKKKRKIPNMANGASAHHANLTAEMAGMGLSNGRHPHDDGDEANGYHYGSASTVGSPSGTGIAGAGRGRYARHPGRIQDRRPLGMSKNAMNASANGHDDSQAEGIISTAIANAQAQTSPSTNENVSVVQQHAKIPPKAGQFTFTVESESANRMVWPGQNSPYPPNVDTRQYDSSYHAVSSMPQEDMRRSVGDSRAKPYHGPQPATQTTGPVRTDAQPPPAPAPHDNAKAYDADGQEVRQRPRKPRRRPSKEYALQARERKVQQEYTNWHKPPAREDVWICEFCEYESIFGSPPEALIRQYEIKDKKAKKEQAERQRLLEKARSRGRKGKKGSKNGKNNGNNAQQPAAPNGVPQAQAGHEQHPDDELRTHYDDGSQGDEYYEDDLDDGSDDISDHLPPDEHYEAPATAGAAQFHAHGADHGGGGVIPNGA